MTWSESVARSLQKHSPDGGGSLLAISSGGFDRAHAWLTAPPGPVCRECPMAGTCRAASSGSEPAAPASVCRSRPSDPAPVPQASAPRRMTRCPCRSLRPPRRSRRCGGPASRLPRESPRATPCRSARGNAGRVLPWLSHVTRSGVSGPSLTLVGSRQWSRLSSFPYRSRTRAPSLRRRYPASAVIQAPPPPCRPGLPLTRFRLECALHRQGFPCCHHPPLPCVPPPLPRRSRPVRPCSCLSRYSKPTCNRSSTPTGRSGAPMTR